MTITRDAVEAALAHVALPGGGTLAALDAVRALSVEGGTVRFVLELPETVAAQAGAIEAAARAALQGLEGVTQLSIVTTAAAAPRRAAPAGPPPSLKVGGHPTPSAGPAPVPGVASIIAIGSGKGGVGKSTLTANLAVALARQGRRVGLLDADIYGPSQPRMMGTMQRPESVNDRIIPPHAHGVTVMSLGLMIADGQAIVWRGPMLQGALQQMLTQVEWGELDVLLVDLPPGTGDVQLTLSQSTAVAGAIIVSTPQDVALIDARRAVDMFAKVKTPILGLVENMSVYVCPNCGHEAHLFGHGGVRDEAERMGVPFLGEIPLDLSIRIAGDAGVPSAAGEGPVADAYAGLARKLVEAGLA